MIKGLNTKITYCLVLAAFSGAAMLGSCTKDNLNVKNAPSPYKDTILPAISLNGVVTPTQGFVGDQVVIHGSRFLKNKDSIKFQFNGQQVTAFTILDDTTAQLTVPALASTGYLSAQVGQQYTFGPFFRVFGPLQMDTVFPSYRGADSYIRDIIPVENGKFLIVGDFQNYDNANIRGGVNRVARINHDGTLDKSFKYGSATGAPSAVLTAAALTGGGQYLVGGNFSSYSNHSYVNAIARLNNNGTMDSTFVVTHSGVAVVVSSLKGGFAGPVTSLKVQSDGKILTSGNFQYYVQPNFSLVSTTGQDSVHLDSTMMNFLGRLNPDGTLDTTYNFDLANHRGYEGPNGPVITSFLQPDNRLIIVGNFTKYDGQPAGHIARINTDGTLDPSFNTGSGTDLSVFSIAQQPDGKYILAGFFNSFDGHPAAGVVRINADGSYDPGFQAGKGSDGTILYASVMPQGQIVLSGNFRYFDGVLRNNFVILNPDGSLHPTYNTNGGTGFGLNSFLGITRIVQLPAEKAFIAVGDMVQFDYRPCNSILRIFYQ